MRKRSYHYYICDFETTVYDGQDRTDVWAAAAVEMHTEDVKILGSVGDFFKFLRSKKQNIIAYFHNLKFDGSFILDYFLNQNNLKQAVIKKNGEIVGWKEDNQLFAGEYKYSISDKGQWYQITLCTGNYLIHIRDSLKLLPLSVKEIGKAFRTSRQKLEMEYEGYRYPNCPISESERQYIANDVLVVKEAMEKMFEDGHNRLTIGSCCLAEYKESLTWDTTLQMCPDFAIKNYRDIFPNVYDIPLEDNYIDYDDLQPVTTVGDYILSSYGGGWCYNSPEKSKKVIKGGLTLDVNSLYPSMMHSDSGNRYPIGLPTFWQGNHIPDAALADDKYYFVRVRCRFDIKPGKLSFLHIRNSYQYNPNDNLTTSDVYNKVTGEYSRYYKDLSGKITDTVRTYVWTMTDYALVRECYILHDFEILDGCYFDTATGIFDAYINKWMEIKKNSTGGMRTESKLFLNNLYGKMAATTDSSFKIAYLNERKTISFLPVSSHEKDPGYIPVGSAITSYARNFTIRAALANVKYFCYADTDSLHLNTQNIKKVKGVKLDSKELCCWKCESLWDVAIFCRQKTYIEHVTHEDFEKLEKPFYEIKCAGMGKHCKDLLSMSLSGTDVEREILEKMEKEEIDFIQTKRELSDFAPGLIVPGNLQPVRLPGGVVLVSQPFELLE